MRWLTGILINAILFIAIAGFFDESFQLSGVGAAITASFVLSILNVLVRPILIILTLPVTVVTLGFFLFVVNAITLSMTDLIMGSSFEIDGFGMALLLSMIMSLANLIIQKMLIDQNQKEK
jgi:putative membrane protein